MNTVKKEKNNDQTFYTITFKVIRGGLYMSPEKEKRISDFWTFCHSLFWPTEVFTTQQQAGFKALIAAHFNEDSANDTFKELVQRAVLAHRYINRHPGRYIGRPQDWLNIFNRSGLTGTAKWYNAVQEQRKTMSEYNKGLSLLARAILNVAMKKKMQYVNAYREAFIELQQQDLVSIYSNATFHFLFTNL